MENFREARHAARMTVLEVSNYLKLSLATVKRYEKTNKAPKAVTECLYLIGGKMPAFGRRNCFDGWSFGQGYLWSPAGERFTSGDVLASRIEKQLIDALYRSNLNLRKPKEAIRVESSKIIPFPSKRNFSDQSA